jgi:hypothetical protein
MGAQGHKIFLPAAMVISERTETLKVEPLPPGERLDIG